MQINNEKSLNMSNAAATLRLFVWIRVLKINNFDNSETIIHNFMVDKMLRNRLSAKDLSTVFVSAGLLIVFFLPIDFLFHNPSTFCIHKNLLQFDCPGCGMTRALNCFMHGQFRQAFSFNIGIAPLVLLIVQHYSSYITQTNFTDIFRRISVCTLTVTLSIQYILKTIQHFT